MRGLPRFGGRPGGAGTGARPAVRAEATVLAELATAMPASGGSYVYLERSFGPWFGTVAGLGLWASMWLKSAFALLGFGAYLSVLVTLPGGDEGDRRGQPRAGAGGLDD